MKRLNGSPVVEVRLVVTFAVSVDDAERIVAKSTPELQRLALDELIRNTPPEETGICRDWSEDWKDFYTAYGNVLADKRATELKMLTAPAQTIEPSTETA